ncbi:calcium-translocating P-type ATPase, PMCA-type [Candidatus Magnetobacterium casense]|uniref:P-type Ca(2+) transporter n=1 Tax=Candidatus Magnetobacterium casense TaxID=1455061 RepID=A0ABS6RXA7_9BACT|nr:calcium-translocating P-type ATPase, PMCA-type [Candidatus Magnetobacterium casensis]MBV6341270.1 calcium-translocating P-type ATPase, PMCA-type [Candidatus Magnetobacterium casensis]
MKFSYIGLDTESVERSRQQHGSNQLAPPEIEGFWEKFIGNFKDPIIIILLVALAIITVLAVFGFAAWYEGVGIAAAVLIATSVATLSEHKNETSFRNLQEEASQILINVFRNGHITEISINDIVVGDFVLLQPGDKVPADGALVAAEGTLNVNQAALTGEADPVKKKVPTDDYIPKELNDLADPYALYRGSVIEDGEAVMKVSVVGEKSMYGQLVKELDAEDRDTPLQVKLNVLAEGISKFGYFGGTFIALSFLFKKILIDNGFDAARISAYLSHWQTFMHDAVTAVILAIIIIVVAVPEGLPMMIAIVLSMNMRKMLREKVLVRKLLGIETAGSINILFSDKTGTITKGQMEVSQFMTGDTNSFSGFDSVPAPVRKLLTLSIKENTSCVINTSEGKVNEIVGGNRVEKALMRYIFSALLQDNNVKLNRTILFSSDKKFSASEVSMAGNVYTLVKGAPEIILSGCRGYYDKDAHIVDMNKASSDALAQKIDELSRRGMRLIALAISEKPITDDSMPTGLKLLGMIAIRDEIRPESAEAIQLAHEAGIQVVMITGDKRETAEAIAKDIGLLQRPNDLIMTSEEINKLSDEELAQRLPDLRVVARALPTDKSRFVKIAQGLNLVVGMTGDGVNDSPALTKADVGFAMGSGTEVAKEAGDIVILDDNFLSITKAVLYGRTIYNSIRKFIVFQLTVSFSAIMTSFLGPFFGVDLPFTLVQLLWVNLVMDTLAALAFGGEAALQRYMHERPKKREESIISKDMWSSVLVNGTFTTIVCILFLKSALIKGQFSSDAAFLTGFFGFFVFIHNFNKFNVRTELLNLFDHILDNNNFLKVVGLIFIVQIIFTYFGGSVLRTVGLSASEWLVPLALSAVIIPVDLLRKALRGN